MKLEHFNRAFSRAIFCFPLFLLTVFYTVDVNAQRLERSNIEDFTDAEIEQLATYITEWLTVDIIQEHVDEFFATPAIGNDSEQGGVHTTRNFLGWHRVQIRALEDFIRTKPNGNQFVPLPKWTPGTDVNNQNPIPVYFNGFTPNGDPYPDFIYQPAITLVEQELTTAGYDFITNGYLQDINPIVPLGDMTNYCSTSYADVGEFSDWFETNYHAAGHAGVNGVMLSTASPAALIFWLYHAHIDEWWYDWENDCGVDNDNEGYTLTDPIYTSTIDFLDGTQFIRGEIVVETGKVLVIQGADLYFQDSEYSGRKSGIRVQPGGTLNIIASTLSGIGIFGNEGGDFSTDDPDGDGIPNEGGAAAAATGVVYNTPWDGIILEEGFANSQPARLQINNNSTIQHARIAIDVQGGTGIVEAQEVSFLDNRHSIILGSPESPAVNNQSFFRSCTFDQTEPLRDVVWKSDQVGFDAFRYYTFSTAQSEIARNHVEIYNITEEENLNYPFQFGNYVMFSGCDFSNIYGATQPQSNESRGIYCETSQFTIEDGSFLSLVEGIYATDNGALTIRGTVPSESSFDNTLRGIVLNNMNQSVIESIDFNIPSTNFLNQVPNIPTGIFIVGTANQAHDIENCIFTNILGPTAFNRGIYSDLGNFVCSGSQFSGLREAVYAKGDPMAYPDAVATVTNGCTFTDNIRGVIYKNVNLSTVESSNFIVPKQNNDPSDGKPLAIYLEGPAAYVVTGNQIDSENNGILTFDNAGIVVENSCLDNASWIAINTIDNLHTAVQTQEYNPQLQIACNNFVNVNGHYSIAVASGALAEQGDCDFVPAGNNFAVADCDNMKSHIFVAPGLTGFTYNAHADLSPDGDCVSIVVDVEGCPGTTTTHPCANLDISFFRGNDPNRTARILGLEQQIQLATNPSLEATLVKQKELEIGQGIKFALQEGGVQGAYTYLDGLLNQQINVYRGDMAALALRIADFTAATSHINAMDNSDPNKVYLNEITQLRLQGSDITELTASELTLLVQTIEGQFPSIPRECISVPDPNTGTEGLQQAVEVISILDNQLEAPLSITTEESKLQDVTMYVYPNPAKDMFTIELSHFDMEQKGAVSVFNANGQLVQQGNITNPKQEWSTRSFPNGLYYIHIHFGDKILREKVVIIQ